MTGGNVNQILHDDIACNCMVMEVDGNGQWV